MSCRSFCCVTLFGIVVLASTAALAAPGHGRLLPPLAAPDQHDDPPMMDLLRRMVSKQLLMVPGADLMIDIDGGVEVDHRANGVVLFSMSFGSARDNVGARRALEETFEQRAEIRERYMSVAMEGALSDLPSYLDKVWEHGQWSVALRRRILFQLWDECAEHGPPRVVRGGAQAREIISRFINWRLPANSPHSYTAAELEYLNSRRDSAQMFAPYGATPRPLVATHLASLAF